MTAAPQLVPGYRFGAFVLDCSSGELRRNGARLKLQEQPFQILVKLLENPGSLVTREELHSTLWPADTFVDFDTGLNSAIKRLREVLGDSAGVPRYIETVPRRGYRFIAPLNDAACFNGAASLNETRSQATVVAEKSASVFSPAHLAIAALALLLAAGTGALVVWLRSPLPSPQIIGSTQLTWDGLAKGNLRTDGKSLFYSERRDGRFTIFQIPIGGGSPGELDLSSAGFLPGEISPDGAQILLVPHKMGTPEPTVRIMDLASASVRDVSGIHTETVAWAPGNKLVYAQGRDLFIAGQDGSGRRKLLTASGMIHSVGFSPDGKRIRMSVVDRLKFVGAIWEARADGSGLHELLPGWHSIPQECCGTWTPDGRYYVFQSFERGSSKIWVIPDKEQALRKTPPVPVLLTTVPLIFNSPAPSRDGKKLFVLAEQPRAELIRYDSNSGQFLPFLSGISAGDVEASPDTHSFVYVRYPDRTLWRSRADGSEPVELTSPLLHVALPHWSPDGNRIAFSAQKQGSAWNIYLMPASGGAAEQITFGTVADLDPAWSPDGKTLAFGQNFPSSETVRISIQLLNLENNMVNPMQGSDGLCCPRWSPDGRYLAAEKADSWDEIVIYDFVAQKWRVAVKGIGTVGYFTFTRDSKSLVFDTQEVKDPYFYRLRMEDFTFAAIVSLKDSARFYSQLGAWSGVAPDGSPLLVRDVSNQEIYALDWRLP
jgi:Tol biopolymer transport system component/DNA-binding winged helix-turn-helix (wHTH) protein